MLLLRLDCICEREGPAAMFFLERTSGDISWIIYHKARGKTFKQMRRGPYRIAINKQGSLALAFSGVYLT